MKNASLLLITVLSLTAFAGDSGFYVSSNTITGWDRSHGAPPADLVIPAQVNGVAITAIGEWAFHDWSNIETLVVSEGIKTIGEGAFDHCKGLLSITLPNSLETIDEYAFDECYALQTVKIGTSASASQLTTLGGCAFEDCENLTSIVLPNRLKTIGECAFAICLNLKNLTIPASVTRIDEAAFAGVQSLTLQSGNQNYVMENGALYNKAKSTLLYVQPSSVSGTYTIPLTVKRVGSAALAGCQYLSRLVISDHVTSIGESLIYGCENLTSISIGRSVSEIESWAFESCDSVSSWTVNVANPYYCVEGCALLTKDKKVLLYAYVDDSGAYKIPSSVTMLPEGLFCGNSRLRSVTIPSSVRVIGDGALEECQNLTTVNIQGNVTVIDDWAFYECSNLTSINIPNSVRKIGEGAFEGCGLASVDLPDSLVELWECAFGWCPRLATVTIGRGLSLSRYGEMSPAWFSGCNNLTTVNLSETFVNNNGVDVNSWSWKDYLGWDTPDTIRYNIISDANEDEVDMSPLKPDLCVSLLSVSPTSIKATDAITLHWIVRNQGNTWADESHIYVYVDGVKRKAIEVEDMSIGGYQVGSCTFSPGELSAGTHTIYLKADGGNTIAESNEANNSSGTKTITVQASTTSTSTMDLSISAISVSAVSVTNGQSVKIPFTVKNNGNTKTSGFALGIYDNGMRIATVNVSAYSPYSSRSYTYTVPLAKLTPGTHKFHIVADDKKVVKETNENNNKSATKTVTVKSGMDLSISSISVSATSVASGQTVKIPFTVKNNGNTKTPGFALGIYDNGMRIATVNVSAYSPYSSRSYTYTVPLAKLTPGTHKFHIVADDKKVVKETNENNNKSSNKWIVVK